MAKITITLDNVFNDDLSNIAEVAAEYAAVQAAIEGTITMNVAKDDDGRIIFHGTVPGTEPEAPKPVPTTRVVEVNAKYTYLLYVDDHGEVRAGGTVDVESSNGGHWSGTVTDVWDSVEEYMNDHDSPPTLVVMEVIDPGPRK